MLANDVQHGGDHYKRYKIQPWDFIIANDVPYMEATTLVYVLRWREKGGVEDLFKAIHYLEKLIEIENAKTGKPVGEGVLQAHCAETTGEAE